MKLWIISQNANTGYDTYDSAVVAADTEDEARKISPSGVYQWSDDAGCWMFEYADGRLKAERHGHQSDWVSDVSIVKVREIGQAKDGTAAGLVLASFNAG